MGVARHVLGGLGTFLVGMEILDEATVQTLIGAIMALGSALWSVLSPEKNQ
jgi:hypothetical protein